MNSFTILLYYKQKIHLHPITLLSQQQKPMLVTLQCMEYHNLQAPTISHCFTNSMNSKLEYTYSQSISLPRTEIKDFQLYIEYSEFRIMGSGQSVRITPTPLWLICNTAQPLAKPSSHNDAENVQMLIDSRQGIEEQMACKTKCPTQKLSKTGQAAFPTCIFPSDPSFQSNIPVIIILHYYTIIQYDVSLGLKALAISFQQIRISNNVVSDWAYTIAGWYFL